MRFIIYIGNQANITLKANSGTIYKLTKGVPHPIKSIEDQNSLINYTEQKSSGCATCNKRSITRPITTDEYYSKFVKMTIEAFRDKWEKYYRENLPQVLIQYGLQ